MLPHARRHHHQLTAGLGKSPTSQTIHRHPPSASGKNKNKQTSTFAGTVLEKGRYGKHNAYQM